MIILTDEEMALAEKIGKRRNDEDDAAGFPKGGAFLGFDESGYAQNILGVCGEIAFSKFLGIPYSPPAMKSVDVKGYEVRTASKESYRLIIRPRDANDKKFVLVVKCGDRAFKVQGWITAGEAKEVGERKNPDKGRGAGPAWFVPAEKLHSFGGDLVLDRVGPPPTKWDEETLSNIEWFKTAKLPAEGFSLNPGLTVVNTELFRKSLEMDIAQGPGGIRSKTGAVQQDLRRLRELFGA